MAKKKKKKILKKFSIAHPKITMKVKRRLTTNLKKKISNHNVIILSHA